MKNNLLKNLSIIALLMPNLAFAALGTTTATFGVSTNAKPVCTVSATALNFGDYDGVSDVKATSTFTLACDSSSSPTWQMDGGLNYFNAKRNLSNGTKTQLYYDLYQDNTTTYAIAVNTAINTYAGTTLAPDPKGVVYTVYGTIPSGQLPDTTTTAYSDTITITI